MSGLLLKAVGLWFVILIAAIANAAFRDKVLAPAAGPKVALPASGLILSALIAVISWFSITTFNSTSSTAYLLVGVIWFSLTLSFELILGHFVSRKPWREVLQVFNLRNGDLFSVALLMTLAAPWVSARLHGLI